MADTANPSPPQMPSISDRITEAIAQLRQLTQKSVQSQWRLYSGDLATRQAVQATYWQSWSAVSLNARNHVAWPRAQVRWLGQRIVVPHDLQGYPLQGLSLRLALTWWAQSAQVYVNGEQVQEGDLFDATTRLLLSPSVIPHNCFDVAIRLESPGHDDGALVRSLCIYELADEAVHPTPEPGFVADELAVLQCFLTTFAPDQLPILAQALELLSWSALSTGDRSSFDQTLATLRQQLLPLADLIQQRQIRLLGHAHLDMAWLWTVSETWEAAERTFRSVLNLQKDFPALTYCHTTPALYEWIEQHRPDLFAAIQAQVAAGRWEVAVAPLWVEPDLNLISGEAIARHLLYGQRYLDRAFGQRGTVAWLPDTFGFNWQLPQLLRQGGVDYFVTQKLRWNDTTQFPYEAHWWRSPDGTDLLSLHSAPIGEGIDPVKMAQYACTWEEKTGSQTSLWLPGVGDHGGGPTRDMLEIAQRWERSPFFPKLNFTTAHQFLTELHQQITAVPSPETSARSLSLPIWNGELYLELHRGCYTNHADQKAFNRRGEDLLYQAELFASLNTLMTGADYPQTDLEMAWKKVLFNQFHDILPGSSITPVFTEANQTWQAAIHTAEKIRQTALEAIAAQIRFPALPHPQARRAVVFNPLNWTRSEVVSLSVQQSQEGQSGFWQIYDLEGQELPSQLRCWQVEDQTHCEIFFRAEAVPAIGYRCYWLVPGSQNNLAPVAPPAEGTLADLVLENDQLRVEVDPATGNLASLFDKEHQRQLLSCVGNELQAFQDQGQYWDAWNIDPNYAQFPLPPAQLIHLAYEDCGSMTTRIRVIRKLGQSTFNQLYILDQGSRVLKIQTQVDWQDRHVVVKAAFPLQVDASYATYEISCGAIQRSTRPQTEAELAKWEVPALRWADLSNDDHSWGVSILSDSKQGYDSQPDQIRLTLLRGSEWPDPTSDRGLHHFTYAVYPHDQSWQTAQTVQRGYELNQTLYGMVIDPPGHEQRMIQPDSTANLPPIAQFLDLQADNLVLTAFKRAEDDPNHWILRCYEAQGQTAHLNLKDASGLLFRHCLSSVTPTNLLEEAIEAVPSTDQGTIISPWKVATFRIARSGSGGWAGLGNP